MKKFFTILGNILKWILIVFVALIVILLIVRFIGRTINNAAPSDGINESMYIDVNGQQQWINIYGENKENPVMLYLHGGPGDSHSYGDWVILRKLAKDYTVVNWDQRDCGKTWINDPKGTPITPEIMRDDLSVVVDYLLDYMGKEKLTLLGMSWGTMYGGDYALEHPDKVECMISLSLVYDDRESQKGLKEDFLKWSENEPEYHEMAEKYDPLFFAEMTENKLKLMNDFMNAEQSERAAMEQNNPELSELIKNSREQSQIAQALNARYLPEEESYFDGDINVIEAVFFNPYYSLFDYFKILQYDPESDFSLSSQNFIDDFSLKNRTVYEMPYYVLQGDKDDNGGVEKSYFDSVKAPDKEFRYIEGGHMSTMLQSEKLAEFIHEIAQKQKTVKE